MSLHLNPNKMDNSNQSLSHSSQMPSQGYTHQMQSAMWTGNKVCQNTAGQNANIDSYSQQMNRYYQGHYPSHHNVSDINRYMPSATKNQNSVQPSYNPQYPVANQNSYPGANSSQMYHAAVKSNCSNSYYGNINSSSSSYSTNNITPSPKKYVNSSLGLSQAPPGVPQNAQMLHNSGVPMPQMPHYGDQSSFSMQNMYVNNYNMHQSVDNQQGYSMVRQQQLSSPTTVLPSSQETSSVHSTAMPPTNQVSQVSSIPTPPETSSLPSDGCPSTDNTSSESSTDNTKMSISSPSFVLPGSAINHMPTSMPSSSMTSVGNTTSIANRNVGNSLQSPANLDEGSQASSASASSSIPDEQNSAKTSSKPNFSYPPTPNTLSSPGAASMSSFHDELECISSPGWPKTPASPVANSNYEFANIKRPENLLKLYTLSDDPDRRSFLDRLIVFNEEKGSPITQCPTISKQPLDVFRVYKTVKERGGFVEVTNAKRWKDIAGAIGVGASSSAAYTLRKQYMKLLLPFECKFDRGGIDPQPIINMVEASSRKKGKSSPTNGYGGQNHCNQGYPMERYNPGYSGAYQPNRYHCNNSNVDYQCSSGSMHYSQSMPHSSSSSSSSSSHQIQGQSQYNQYSHNSQSNYGYYQGNNATSSPMYSSNNNNMQANVSNNNNMCRYAGNATPSPVPQEQGYYPQQYAATQQQQQSQGVQETAYQSNRATSVSSPVVVTSSSEQQNVSTSTTSTTTQLPSESSHLQKSSADNTFVTTSISTVSSVTSSSSETVQTTTVCSTGTYNSISNLMSQDQTSVTIKRCNSPVPSVCQPYQNATPSSPLNKVPETSSNYYSSASTPHQSTVISYSQSSYQNKKLPYQMDYQSKEQTQAQPQLSQYTHYGQTQNETYRGSEGPPGYQNDQNRNIPNPEITVNNSKPYQYSCGTPKANMYNYAASQMNQTNKEAFNNAPYSNQYNNRPPRGWMPEQSQYSYQQSPGQRMQLSNQPAPPDIKPNLQSLRMQKPWFTPRDGGQAPNRLPQPSMPSPIPHQNLQPNKPLEKKYSPQAPLSASQGFQSIMKRPLEFPPNTVEAVRPVAVKRRRCPAKRVGPVDAWRIMLALKSGLLSESTWALDVLSILLCDHTTVIYFGLSHMPGLLGVLVEHYRCFLNKIFHIADDLEIGSSTTTTAKSNSNSKDSEKKKIPNGICESRTNWLEKSRFVNGPNYTYRTRCRKRVEIQCDEALFLIDPLRSWDKYEGFDVPPDHWQKGGGDTTMHIQTCFETTSNKIKFCRNLDDEKPKQKTCKKSALAIKPSSHTLKGRSGSVYPSLLSCKGEPIVVLEKCDLRRSKMSSMSEEESDTDVEDDVSVGDKKCNDSQKGIKNFNRNDESEEQENKNNFLLNGESKLSSDTDEGKTKLDESDEKVTTFEGNMSNADKVNTDANENFPRLRGSLSSRKRFLTEKLEDEAYCYDQPALCVISDSQEMLSRRCACIATVLRNLSFVPGNDLEMKKHPGFLILLGKLLLLHHDHKPAKNSYHKYEKEADGSSSSTDDSCISLKDEHEWWWATLNVLRENTLVTLSNISGQLDLSPFPQEVSFPILDGLLHWVVCPSSYAQDPLPSNASSSVLSPQRLCLESLCKLSVLSSNVDLIVATPPWSRIEGLFAFLTKSLSHGQDQIMREFAVILLSNLSQADAIAARTIAEQSRCISNLINFIEEAEANAFQIASTQGIKRLKDKPELMGTTPGMVHRAASTLKSLALVPENQALFLRHQQRLLSLVTSQVMDQELAVIIADVLFYCSEMAIEDASCQTPVS